MRMHLHQLLISNLAGHWDEDHFMYRDKEYAYNRLKEISGQDFGYDADKWKEWFNSPAGRKHLRDRVIK